MGVKDRHFPGCYQRMLGDHLTGGEVADQQPASGLDESDLVADLLVGTE